MCTTKAPKPQSTGDSKKPVQYMHNVWLDGLGIMGSDQRGRNSLRIDPGTPRQQVNFQPPPWTNVGGNTGGGGLSKADQLMNSGNNTARFIGLMAKGMGIGSGPANGTGS